MLEYYEAYTDYNYQMNQFEELIAHLARKVTGGTKVTYQGTEIDFTPPWRRLTVYDGVREYAGIDPETATEADLFAKVKELGGTQEKPTSHGEMVMELFELSAESELIQPTFVIDFPKEVSPLTKMHRDKEGLVSVLSLFVLPWKLVMPTLSLMTQKISSRVSRSKKPNGWLMKKLSLWIMIFMHAIDVGMPPTAESGLALSESSCYSQTDPAFETSCCFQR